MITAISQFKAPPGTTLEMATAMFKASVPNYTGFPGLVRKYYLFGEDGFIRGIYLWENRAAAEKLYTEHWRKSVKERFGSDPTVTYFETPVIIDNTAPQAAAKSAA